MTNDPKKYFADKMRPGILMYVAIILIVIALGLIFSIFITEISNLVLIIGAVVLFIFGGLLMSFTPQVYCFETKQWAETVIGWYDIKEEANVLKAINEENFSVLENIEIAKDAGNMIKLWVRYCPKTFSIAQTSIEKYVEWRPSDIASKKIIRGEKIKNLVEIVSKNDKSWNG